ncbi:MAG: tetratricopeptide repeat protein [Verrucomicrobiota bacterium]|jgi:tetratricopeptide (TPR) repeat protein
MKRFFHGLATLVLTASVAPAETNLSTAPDVGTITNLIMVARPQSVAKNPSPRLPDRYFETQLEQATRQRHDKNPALAAKILVALLQTNAPPEFKRKALLDLALAEQDNNEFVKAQQAYAQFRHLYSEDPSIPEILLREGLLYRQMGANTLAISKFYAVMSTALKLKLDNIDYYKTLVLQAQTEIADTYYLQAQFDEAADFFSRILKNESASLNREPLEFKLIRSLSYVTNHVETIARAQLFLEQHPVCADVPEVRFLLASAYKGVGRNQDAMKQVLLLLQSQQENVSKDPEVWVYWQRRAGNQIANQLYREGDYLDALQIYQSLAGLDTSISWRAPVWYQIGLVYEQLQQWQKASDTYSQITACQKDLTGTNSPPSLASLCEMAQWRKDYIAWMDKARASNLEFLHSPLRKPESSLVQ